MNKSKGKVLDFIPAKVKKIEKDIAEKGIIGNLNYTVFKRGNLHFEDKKKGLTFKKDCTAFEDEMEKLDLNELNEDQSKTIKGCGDNDNLVFTCKNGDIIVSLEKHEYSMLTKLKKIIHMGK